MKNYNVLEMVSKLKLFAKIGEPHVIEGVENGLEIFKKLPKKFRKSVDKDRNLVIIWRIS